MALIEKILHYSKDSSKIVCVTSFDTPVGKVVGAADEDYLYILAFEDSKNFEKMFQSISSQLNCCFVKKDSQLLELLRNEVEAYFGGKLKKKFTVPIKTFGSEFQKEVWEKLQQLPYASTQTYGDLAKDMGKTASYSRAVGAACGANTHLLVIPCHRLVASGSKGGFSSGIERKEWLLEHEKRYGT